MNDYMLIYKGGDPDFMEKATEQEMANNMQQWQIWMEQLEAKGRLVTGGSPLNYSGKHLSHDKVVTDVAVTELKELVTGYSIIKAENIEQAVDIAKTSPIFQYPDTHLEVRQVMDI